MIFARPAHRSPRAALSWARAAFIVEAMLLLVFLIGSIAVFTQLFAAASDRGAEARNLSSAVAAAEGAAERFAADPAGAQGGETADGLRVTCDVVGDDQDAGTLYHAYIAVYGPDGNEPIYSLSTSRYASEVR